MRNPKPGRQTPPHSPRITRKRAARVRHILATALDLARAEGRHGLTLKALADRLDLTPAALYRYFPSKDALMAELQQEVIETLSVATREHVDEVEAWSARTGQPEADRALLAVAASALAFEAFAYDSPVEFALLAMELSAPEFTLPEPEAARVFESAWSALSDLAARLDDCVGEGALEPGDSEQRAITLWASIQGVAQTRKLARTASERIDPRGLARGLVSTLLIGWGAEPERARHAVQAAGSQVRAQRRPAEARRRAASR